MANTAINPHKVRDYFTSQSEHLAPLSSHMASNGQRIRETLIMPDAISPRAALADLRKATPEQFPLYIGFAHVSAALAHKEGAGGWVFVPDNAAGAVWFDAAYFTPSAIMRHQAAKGSGRLL